MLVTSVAIPPLASWHWLGGLARHFRPRRRLAVLFDRDGTLVEDVPYNGDPSLVRPRAGARAALDRLRRESVAIAGVSNQSGGARGGVTRPPVGAGSRPHALVARLDSAGDVLLQGPALRAVAAGSGRVSFLCGPRGAGATELLPGIDEVLVFRAEWIDPEPRPVSKPAIDDLVGRIAGLRPDLGIILTSFHQS